MSCFFYCKENRRQLEQPGVVGSVKEGKRQVEHVRLLKRLRAVSAVGGSVNRGRWSYLQAWL